MTEGVVSTGDRLVTGGLNAAIIATGGVLAAVAEPSGAGALAFAYVTPVAVMNIRAWGPFQDADDAWTNLSGEFADMARKLEQFVGETDPFWQGAGSEAFKSFINTKMIPSLESLQQMCEQASAGCSGTAEALETIFYTWLGATVAAIVACIAANVAGPAGPAAKWTIIGIWVAFVSALLVAVIAIMQGMRGASSAMGTAMQELKRGFEIEGDKVVAGTSKLSKDQRDLIANPENWNKEAEA